MIQRPTMFIGNARKISAFSLTELLVVIGVLALLVGLLFPAATKALESGKQVRCVSNLRTIGAAFRMFANDNENRFPYGEISGNSSTYDGGEQWWFALQPYMLKLEGGKAYAKAFVCPARKRTNNSADYAINIYIGTYGPNYLAIEKPSKIVLAGDRVGNNWHLNVPSMGGYPADGYPAYIHKNRANVLFVDGHTDSLSPAELDKDENFNYF